MSTASPHAPAWVPCCPGCHVIYTACTASAYPLSFQCGHSLCSECADAVLVLSTPACLSCQMPIEGSEQRDPGLASLGDAFVALAGPQEAAAPLGGHIPRVCSVHAGAPLSMLCVDDGIMLCEECSQSKHHGHALLSLHGEVAAAAQPALSSFLARVEELGARCAAASTQQCEFFALVQGARERMTARAAASLDRLEADAVAVKAAVDAHVASRKADVAKELKAQLKALDAQLDMYSVSANQLACAAAACVAACRDAAAVATTDTAAHVTDALATATRASALIQPYRGPCASTVVEAVPEQEVAVSALAAWSRVRHAVSPATSTLSGDGLDSFQADHPNVIMIEARDASGAAVCSLDPADVVLWFHADAGTPVPSAQYAVTRDAAHRLRVTYTVDASVQTMNLGMSVGGAGGFTGVWFLRTVSPDSPHACLPFLDRADACSKVAAATTHACYDVCVPTRWLTKTPQSVTASDCQTSPCLAWC